MRSAADYRRYSWTIPLEELSPDGRFVVTALKLVDTSSNRIFQVTPNLVKIQL